MKVITIVVPAYNEGARIRTTLAQAIEYFNSRGTSCELIVAADGTDGTREVARELAASDLAAGISIRVIGTPARRGKGLAVREGVRLATGDVIGFVDADNKTPITEFAKIEPCLIDGYDVVIGSRSLADSQIERRQPWYRRLGSRGYAIVKRACVGLDDIVDTQCGFKFFQGDIARYLFQRQTIDGYMFDVEILYMARQCGYRIAQVPVRWRDDGDSRLQLVTGNLQNLRDTMAIRQRHRALVGQDHRRAALPTDA